MSTTFAIEYNGLNMDTSSKYTIHGVENLAAMDSRVVYRDNTGRSGGAVHAAKTGARTIPIVGSFHADDADDYKDLERELASTFVPSEEELYMKITRWTSSTAESRSIRAVVSQMPKITERPGYVDFNQFSVLMLCPEGYFVDNTETSVSTGLSTALGMPLPAPLPMMMGSVNNTVDAYNAGEYEIYAKFTITGGATNPTITNRSTGESFSITGTFSSSDVVVIDNNPRQQSIKKNGNNIYSSLVGDVFDLRVGANEIAFNSDTDSDTALLTITYRQAYSAL